MGIKKQISKRKKISILSKVALAMKSQLDHGCSKQSTRLQMLEALQKYELKYYVITSITYGWPVHHFIIHAAD